MTNRITISLIVILGLAAFWEFRVKPIRAPIYKAAVNDYRTRHYAQSLVELRVADEFEPNDPSVLSLMGWNSLKLDQDHAAEKYFSRASRFAPRDADPLLGWIYVEIALEKYQQAEHLLAEFKNRFGETEGYRSADSSLLDQLNRKAAPSGS